MPTNLESQKNVNLRKNPLVRTVYWFNGFSMIRKKGKSDEKVFFHPISQKHILMKLINYNLSTVSNSNLISFHTSHAAANSGLHLHAARITSPPS